MSSPRDVPAEPPRAAPTADGVRVHVVATLAVTAAALLSAVGAATAYATGEGWQLAAAVTVLLAGVLFVDRRPPSSAVLPGRGATVPAAAQPAAGLSAAGLSTAGLSTAGFAKAAGSTAGAPASAAGGQAADDDRLLDPLTKLSSRQTLTLMAGPMIEHARRSGLAVHCLYLDVVELAQVNQTHGQAVGDDLLVSVALALTDAVRGTDVVARWGGDEFVVIGPGTGISPLELERRLAARPGPGGTTEGSGIGAGVPGAATALPGDVSVGSSTLVPWDEGGLDSLLRRAEQDMALRRSLRQQARQRPAGLGEAARRARDTPA